MQIERGGGGDLSGLAEGCIANVVSFTGPLDACRFSVVSSLFRSAAESDVVWERFLPPDYRSILSASSHSSLVASTPSKKQLFFTLCDHPILIDHGKKSFWLDKWSGKKCYMLSAKDLKIVWGDTARYWRTTNDPNSRFGEMAELISVCWLEISGKIDTRMLSPSTLYATYMVFKLTERSYGFEFQPVEVVVGLVGGESCTKTVFLHPENVQRRRRQIGGRRRRFGLFHTSHLMGFSTPETLESNAEYSKERGDGWLEIELGAYFCEGSSYGELEMSILEVKGGDWKGGIIVEGIEIRPKDGK